jgi:recombinational DNA repair protein RecT
VKINSQSALLNPTTMSIIGAAVAGVVIGLVVANRNGSSRDPIQAQPPDIRPK